MSIFHDLCDLQRYWHNLAANFCQSNWDSFLNFTGEEDPLTLYSYGAIFIVISIYWLIGGLFTIMDITNKPRWIQRYKIQPNTNEPIEMTKLAKAILLVLFNQLVGIPATVFIYYIGMHIRGFRPIRELPTIHLALFHFMAMLLIEEIGFYYTHRLFHNRLMYKYIHKIHHDWTSPIAITAMYCHPIEQFFCNLLPPILGVVLTRCHLITAWLWMAIGMLSALNAHSGYHFPFFPSSESHNFHHLKFNTCYGAFGILDRIHGTDKNFRSTAAYRRHVIMFSLMPPRQAFPDTQKNK